MSPLALSHCLALSLLGLLLLPSLASADWLVTQDAETRGSWEVRGKLVVFTDALGALRSLRLAEVDPEASDAATREAEELKEQPPAPVPKKEPARRQATFVLTDADVGHVTDPGPADAGTSRTTSPSRPVILYSTSWCGYCRKARQLLRSRGVPFVEKEIEKSAAANREYLSKARGYDGVPLLDIGGNLVRGFKRDLILRHLRQIQQRTRRATAG